MHVRVQGLVDVGADGIHRAGDVRRLQLDERGRVRLLEHPEDGLPHRAGHVIQRQEGIALDGRHELGHAAGHRLGQGAGDLLVHGAYGPVELGLHQVTRAAEHRGLAIADECDVAVIILIGARRADLREIIRQGDFPVVAGHFDFRPGLVQGLVRPDRHIAAVVQGESLRLRQQGEGRRQQGKH